MFAAFLRVCFFFFFSSRRRHTRLTCDWSSDVCSSDLHPTSDNRISTKLGSAMTLPTSCLYPGPALRYSPPLAARVACTGEGTRANETLYCARRADRHADCVRYVLDLLAPTRRRSRRGLL